MRRLDAAQIRTAFPFLNVPDDADGLIETGSAGYISPRGLVAAQTALAAEGGAALLRDVADTLRPVSGGIEIATMGGDTVIAEKVIVATGAFTQAWGLTQKNLNLKVYGRTVVLARIEDAMLGEFKGMPTMIHCESDAYILPPIRYPDGYRYLKLGNGSDRMSVCRHVRNWTAGSRAQGRRAIGVISHIL